MKEKKKRKTFVQRLCAQLVEQFKRKGDCEEEVSSRFFSFFYYYTV